MWSDIIWVDIKYRIANSTMYWEEQQWNGYVVKAETQQRTYPRERTEAMAIITHAVLLSAL